MLLARSELGVGPEGDENGLEETDETGRTRRACLMAFLDGGKQQPHRLARHIGLLQLINRSICLVEGADDMGMARPVEEGVKCRHCARHGPAFSGMTCGAAASPLSASVHSPQAPSVDACERAATAVHGRMTDAAPVPLAWLSVLLAEPGLAPITRASGRSHNVRFRYAGFGRSPMLVPVGRGAQDGPLSRACLGLGPELGELLMERVAAVLVKVERQVELSDGLGLDEPRLRGREPTNSGVLLHPLREGLFSGWAEGQPRAAAYSPEL
jgi:hypothetical protein